MRASEETTISVAINATENNLSTAIEIRELKVIEVFTSQ
jgi:hypothetical protein